MELKLNKKKLKNLSNDNAVLPAEMTPQIAGGTFKVPVSVKCGTVATTDQSYMCPTHNCM